MPDLAVRAVANAGERGNVVKMCKCANCVHNSDREGMMNVGIFILL